MDNGGSVTTGSEVNYIDNKAVRFDSDLLVHRTGMLFVWATISVMVLRSSSIRRSFISYRVLRTVVEDNESRSVP